MEEHKLKQFLLDKISEITEEVHQSYQGSCPFCLSNEYPVNGCFEGSEELMKVGLPAEEYHIDHCNDCLITILDKYYAKIEKEGLW
jgi:hypothetical protein